MGVPRYAPLFSLEHGQEFGYGIARIVWGTVADNAGVTLPRWKQVVPGLAPVLRRTAGVPSPSP